MTNKEQKIVGRSSQLFLLLAVTLALSLIFYFSKLLFTSSENERSSRIYEQSLVASISQFEYLPALIAADDSLTNVVLDPQGDTIGVSKKLQFMANRSGADAIYIMDREGNVRGASNYDDENGGFLNQNYSFRPYFQQAIAEGSRQFYYAKGATTGIPGFFISSPIIHENKPVGVAVVKLYLKHWESKWQDSGENIVVADENNVIILSTEDKWRYKVIGSLPENVLNEIRAQKQFAKNEHTTLYSRYLNLGFSGNSTQAFWLINKSLYLVNTFPIEETNWTLYYLVNHDAILTSSLLFFVVTTLLLFMGLVILRGRRSIIESRKKHRFLELKRREELQTVMDNIHIGVILLSKSGVLLSANQYAKHLLLADKLTTPELSIHINEVLDINTDNLASILLKDITSPAYHETWTITGDKPALPVMFAVSEVRTMDRDAYLMTLVNIQRRKIAEDELKLINENLEAMVEDRSRELETAQAALIQKNKAAALGRMAATIVHELSQPLTAMNSSIAAVTAKMRNQDFVGASESLGRLSPLSKKMQNVIKLLKSFSYQDKDSYEIIDLERIIKQTLNSLRDTLQQKNIDVEFNKVAGDYLINANAVKIEIILSNLLQNAIDAMEQTQSPHITINLDSAGESAQLKISDNGSGIDKNVMEKLFSPYFTTKEVGKGLGLGLSITYEIVQEYNGTIDVGNSEDGAYFVIKLPLVKSQEMALVN